MVGIQTTLYGNPARLPWRTPGTTRGPLRAGAIGVLAAYRSDAAPALPTDPVKIEFAASRAGNAEWMVDAGAVRAGAIGVLRSLPHRSDVAPPPASARRPRSNKTEIGSAAVQSSGRIRPATRRRLARSRILRNGLGQHPRRGSPRSPATRTTRSNSSRPLVGT